MYSSFLQRLASYYGPGMPLALSWIARGVHGDSDRFLDQLLHLPDLAKISTKNRERPRTTKQGLFMYWGYYVWIVYIFAGVLTMLSSPILGFAFLLLSPLLVVSSLYVGLYVAEIPARFKSFFSRSSSRKD